MKNATISMQNLACDAEILLDLIGDAAPRDMVDIGANLSRTIKTLEKIQKTIKEGILANAKGGELRGDVFRALVIETAGRVTLDTARLKADMPAVFESYSKISGPIVSIRYGA